MSNLVHGFKLTNAEHFRWLVTGRLPKPRFPKKGTRKPERFPGIIDAARRLGVSRVHLYLVLSGRRESRSLTLRYHALRKGDGR
jgi:hypothetical protein